MGKLPKSWWAENRCRFILEAPYGTRIPAPPPSFRFKELTSLTIDGSGFLITDAFLLCFSQTDLTKLSARGCRLDPEGIDFSVVPYLHTLNLTDCGMGSCKRTARYATPLHVYDLDLAGNGITDLKTLKIRTSAATREGLILDLSRNPIRDVSDLDLSECHGLLDTLWLNNISPELVHGWTPFNYSCTIGLEGCGLTTIPRFLLTTSPCRINFFNNPITDITPLCCKRSSLYMHCPFYPMDYVGCPLDTASRMVVNVAKYLYVNGLGDELMDAYTIATRQILLLWCCEKRLPRDLCRSLRPYLV